MADELNLGYDGLALPYSPESEQSIIGSILLDPSCIDIVMDRLPTIDYFFLQKHKDIYAIMLELSAIGKPIDYVTVLESFKFTKDFDESTDKSYLISLMQLVPSTKNIEAYIDIVKSKYDIRTLITISRDTIEEAVNGDSDPEQLLDSAEQKIMNIRQGKSVRGLEHIKTVLLKTYDEIERLASDDGDSMRVPTGIGDLDNVIYGLNKSDLIILAARPGMGKTSFALNMFRNAGIREKKRVVFFSLEMSKEQLVSRMLSSEALVDSKKLRSGDLDDKEWERLVNAASDLSHGDMYFDDSTDISVNEMKARIRRLGKVDLVVIDYLQLMSSKGRVENRVQEISQITRNLKILAKEFQVPVVLLSQLSRSSERREGHKPMLSDLRDSGSIEQDADIVIFLSRDSYYQDNDNEDNAPVDINSSECIVAKNRHGETATIKLHWQGEFTRFTGVEVIHREM